MKHHYNSMAWKTYTWYPHLTVYTTQAAPASQAAFIPVQLSLLSHSSSHALGISSGPQKLWNPVVKVRKSTNQSRTSLVPDGLCMAVQPPWAIKQRTTYFVSDGLRTFVHLYRCIAVPPYPSGLFLTDRQTKQNNWHLRPSVLIAQRTSPDLERPSRLRQRICASGLRQADWDQADLRKRIRRITIKRIVSIEEWVLLANGLCTILSRDWAICVTITSSICDPILSDRAIQYN